LGAKLRRHTRRRGPNISRERVLNALPVPSGLDVGRSRCRAGGLACVAADHGDHGLGCGGVCRLVGVLGPRAQAGVG